MLGLIDLNVLDSLGWVDWHDCIGFIVDDLCMGWSIDCIDVMIGLIDLMLIDLMVDYIDGFD